MQGLAQDLRYAVRTLAQNRSFAAIAMLCIALGIAVNTTVFSIANAAYLRPLPFDRTGRLVFLDQVQPKAGIFEGQLSFPNYADWREASAAFGAMGAYQWRLFTLSGGEEPEQVDGLQVSASLFPMLGARPALGRLITEADDRAGAEPVVLLGDAIWREKFDANPSILGTAINVNGAPHTIIGVMEAGFMFPEYQKIWTPLAGGGTGDSRGAQRLDVLGILKPGVTMAQADAELGTIAERLAKQYPATNRDWEPRVREARESFVGSGTAPVVTVLAGAVAFVLLIACANVANLMLARATGRGREIAIRTALGATRSRIIRQLLTESVIVAVAGGAVGILLAAWGLELVTSAFPPGQQPYWVVFDIDPVVLAFTVVVTVSTGLIFGLVPALTASRPNLTATLKDGARGASGGMGRNRLRGALVVTEVALSLVLLVGATLMIRSFVNLRRADPGFPTAKLLTMRFYLSGDAYESAAARTLRTADIVRRVSALPGVEAASASFMLPLNGGVDETTAEVEGSTLEKDARPMISFTAATSDFFRTLGVPLLAGRALSEREALDSTHVAVISKTMATRLWKDASPVGRRFRMASDSTNAWYTVVGVVGDIAVNALNRPMRSLAYVPYPYYAQRNTGLLIRTASTPAAVTRAVREQIRAADASLPIYDIATMTEVHHRSFWEYGLLLTMLTVFGGIALFLAAIGIYGVMSYSVSQRRREIGVRVALGARQRDVLRLVVGQGMVLAALGVVIGLAAAAAVTQGMSSLVYGVATTDPLSFASIALFLGVVAALAGLIPARRAARVDPMEALRSD